MESGSSNREESKAPSGDDAVMISPGQEPMAPAPGAAAGEELAVSPPAPAAGPKPYYECVFCKRGFTTAQALGGHMNIHRRDRAKPTTARDSLAGMTTVSRNVECYNKYRHLVSYPPMPAPVTAMAIGSSSSHSSFGMYYPGTAMAAPVDTECGSSPSSVSPRELSLFGAATSTTRDHHDLHLGLACHGDSGDGSSRVPEGSSERQAGEPAERELDLELRLGRRPRH